MAKGVFSDAYLWYKKYHDTNMDPAAWERAHSEWEEICKKYGTCDFVRRVMLAAMCQLEDECM